MSGEHTHPEIAAIQDSIVVDYARLGSLEAAQAATDNVIRSLLARVANLEATPPPVDPPPVEPPVEPPPVTGWTASGIPPAGKTLMGCGPSGYSTSLMASTETKYGAKVGVHRAYFSSGSQATANAVAVATADHAAGRIPWMSTKLPVSWASAGTGGADTWAKDLADKLGALGKPVWIALHHEPENDDTPAAYIAMQRRLLPFFKKHPTIATTVIVTGYAQAHGGQFTWDTFFPGPELVDVYAWDSYNWWGTAQSEGGAIRTNNWEELAVYYASFAAWRASKGPAYAGLRFAVGECGWTNTAAALPVNGTAGLTRGTGAQWLTRAYDDMKAAGGVCLAYFDYVLSSEPSTWTWPITTDPKLSTMRAVLTKADRLP
jgi:hypothetical protein